MSSPRASNNTTMPSEKYVPNTTRSRCEADLRFWLLSLLLLLLLLLLLPLLQLDSAQFSKVKLPFL